jgi:Rap1a immunity proteins
MWTSDRAMCRAPMQASTPATSGASAGARQDFATLERIVMRTGTAVALAMALASPAAMAQGSPAPAGTAVVTHVQTANELAAICDPAWGGVPRLEAIAYCQGFLTSFGQYHALLYPQNGPARPLFCVPVPGPTVAQSGIAFAAWSRENPRYGSEPALDGLLRWAQASFPCPAAPSPRRTR